MAEAKKWRSGALALVCLFSALWACFQWHSLVFGFPGSDETLGLLGGGGMYLTLLMGLWHRDRTSDDSGVWGDQFLIVAVWHFLGVVLAGWVFFLLSS